MINKIVTSLLIYLSIVVLAGCTHSDSGFDCPMKNGVRCQSLDEINAAVDKGEFIGKRHSVSHDQLAVIYATNGEFKDRSSLKATPIRYSEEVMKIWIAPYEDTSGNLHQASNVYVVAKPGRWIGQPMKKLEGDDDV
jgi:conjugal transfer pilus assembly protein TraV